MISKERGHSPGLGTDLTVCAPPGSSLWQDSDSDQVKSAAFPVPSVMHTCGRCHTQHRASPCTPSSVSHCDSALRGAGRQESQGALGCLPHGRVCWERAGPPLPHPVGVSASPVPQLPSCLSSQSFWPRLALLPRRGLCRETAPHAARRMERHGQAEKPSLQGISALATFLPLGASAHPGPRRGESDGLIGSC